MVEESFIFIENPWEINSYVVWIFISIVSEDKISYDENAIVNKDFNCESSFDCVFDDKIMRENSKKMNKKCVFNDIFFFVFFFLVDYFKYF